MRRIRIPGVGGLTAMAFAVSASATTNVDLVASGPFTPGSIVTLTTFVTADGGETDNGIAGIIIYPDAVIDPYLAGSSQVNLSTVGTAAPGWTSGGLGCLTSLGETGCLAFVQINLIGPATAGLTNFPLATTIFLIDPGAAVGTVVSFAWRTTPSTASLDWFGITNAPGVSITVAAPEPTTAALLAIGLAGLAVARRHLA